MKKTVGKISNISKVNKYLKDNFSSYDYHITNEGVTELFFKDGSEEVSIDAVIAGGLDGVVTKLDQIDVAYNAMDKDVYDQMEVVFGTRKDGSASASVAIWEAMLKRPANYVDVSIGLADEAAVIAEATTKLNEADGYGLFLMKRKAQFQAEKQAILDA